jgi:hypothetical protein
MMCEHGGDGQGGESDPDLFHCADFNAFSFSFQAFLIQTGLVYLQRTKWTCRMAIEFRRLVRR